MNRSGTALALLALPSHEGNSAADRGVLCRLVFPAEL